MIATESRPLVVSVAVASELIARLLHDNPSHRLAPVAQAAARHEGIVRRLFVASAKTARAAVDMSHLETVLGLGHSGTGAPLYVCEDALKAFETALMGAELTHGQRFAASKSSSLPEALTKTMTAGANAGELCVVETPQTIWAQVPRPILGTTRIGGELGLTEVEEYAYYTNEGAASINRELRAGLDLSKSTVARIDAIIEKSPKLPSDTVLYRGISARGGETTSSTLDRVFGENLAVGDVLTEKAFLSTTVDRQLAEKFVTSDGSRSGIVLRLETPKGTRALQGRSDEVELILARGTKFKVTKIQEVKASDGTMYSRVWAQVVK